MSERQYGIDPSMVWYDIESNKEHLRKDGEHYVADAMLLRDNVSLRQENESLKMENDRLLKAMNFQDIELGRVADNRDMLRAENESLRKLVRRYGEYTDQDRCEGCVCKSRCNDGDVEECWQLTEIRGLERELGVGGWR